MCDALCVIIKDTIKFYNNVHSYSQLVLLPWGWGYDEPDNIDDLYRLVLVGLVLTAFIFSNILRVAEAGNDALYAVHQKTYEVG